MEDNLIRQVNPMIMKVLPPKVFTHKGVRVLFMRMHTKGKRNDKSKRGKFQMHT